MEEKNMADLEDIGDAVSLKDTNKHGYAVDANKNKHNLTKQSPTTVDAALEDIEIRVVNNDGKRESTIILTRLKTLLQMQLPGMPKECITRVVFDHYHTSLVNINKKLDIVGGIVYRVFTPRRFVEIVFCAVQTEQQKAGHGSRLMNHCKGYVKATSPIMELIVYADNAAMGYFRKHGFTSTITLDPSIWKGCIKDYQKATLMQCTMIPRIRYVNASRMLQVQKEAIEAKIKALDNSRVIHDPPKQWANGIITPIDPLSIPAIKATGWTPEMDTLSRNTHHRGPFFHSMRELLRRVQSHPSSWPFLMPVDKNEVQYYYTIIKSPMDLATVEEKLMGNMYDTPKEMIADLKLIFANCRRFNPPKSSYAQDGLELEKYTKKWIKEQNDWQDLLQR